MVKVGDVRVLVGDGTPVVHRCCSHTCLFAPPGVNVTTAVRLLLTPAERVGLDLCVAKVPADCPLLSVPARSE